jgi:hypothetical protein
VIHYFESQAKGHSLNGIKLLSVRRLESNGTVPWDAEGMILMDMPRGENINVFLYILTFFKTLQKRFRRVRCPKLLKSSLNTKTYHHTQD